MSTTQSTATIRINVDPANPGQYFACCGLLELAARTSDNVCGWFEDKNFCLANTPTLSELLKAICTAVLEQLDPDDATASPIRIHPPFDLRLDWWKTSDRTASSLKVWAGTMESFRIARAMQNAMRDAAFHTNGLLDRGAVAYDPDNLEKKVEPFYFDARRGPNAHSRDVGFSANDLGLTTTACPAVEFLCLVGLQRCQPSPTEFRRMFDYHTWTQPLPPILLPCAVSGLLPFCDQGYRFESWYRTGQRKHKAFLPAKLKTKII
ncbi:MAG: hypothetical protein SFY80_08685 [Verrucomicrobiota bacterium]|nr:hypothetical protein [Verrucomicrobiota bacterium]